MSRGCGTNNAAALAIRSQPKGRRDEGALERYPNAFVVILFLLTVAPSVAGYLLSGTLLEVLGPPETIMGQAQEDLQVTFLGTLFPFGYNVISTVFRALGDSRTPVRFVPVAVPPNAVLDPLFILAWGSAVPPS